MATLATVLGSVGGIDKNDRPASVLSFAQESLLEVSPPCIQNALGKVPMDHAINRQIFYGNETEPQAQIVRQLVQEVFSLVGN